MKNQLSTLQIGEIEEMFQIFFDTKKVLSYNKHTGNWTWYDRDDSLQTSDHGEFLTALEAVEDAVEPYLR